MSRRNPERALFISFMNRAAADTRMLPSHLSLIMAVIYFSEDSESVRVCRPKLMRFSRIKSIATYHKCITDLVSFGYIDYKPSYHPIEASRIKIIHNP